MKRSFENVKDDIINLKKGVNRELLAVEELGSRLQAFVAKEEFYSFVKRLGERLDRIDENLDAYLGYDEDIKSVDAKIKNFEKKLSRQEDLSGEVKEVRALRGKLAAIEGSTVSAQKFNEAVGRLSSDVSYIKGSMLTGKALDSLKAKLADSEKRAERLEKSVPSRGDVSGCVEAVEEVRESVRRVEVDSQKRLEEIEKDANKKLGEISGSLKTDMEMIKASFVDKAVFEKSLKELRKESASIRSVLENSVSEVDFSDYATKKELGKKLLALEELNSDIRRVAQDNAELENSLGELKRETASLDDVKKIGVDVKEISDSMDSLRAAIEKAIDSGQKRFSHELEQTRAKFEKEISRLKDDFGGKLEKEKASAKGGEGVISRIGRGFADFFREEEEKEAKVKAKPSPGVSELLKEEEKKKSRKGPGFGRFLMPVIITAVVAVLFLVVFWLANRAEDGTKDIGGDNASGFVKELPPAEDAAADETSGADVFQGVSAAPGTIEYCRQEHECRERGDGSYWFSCYLDDEGTCRCFVTDAEGCGVAKEKPERDSEQVGDGRGKAGYVAASVVVFAVFLAAYFLVLRNSKAGAKKQKKGREKGKEEEGEGVDLEEFFQKK